MPMIAWLRILWAMMLGTMLVLTVVASLERGVAVAAVELWTDAWFRATVADAYFAFLTIYAWIAYKERSAVARGVWLMLVVCLGTIGIATYVLLQLWRLQPGDSLDRMLLRTP